MGKMTTLPDARSSSGSVVVAGPLRALAAEHMEVDFLPGKQLSVSFEVESNEARASWATS